MKKASIRELHDKTGQLVQKAADGETFIILRRGVPVAELRALSPEPAFVPMPDHSDFLATLPQTPDSSWMISEDRDRE